MKIIITENKIRNIVRSELKNYLIQEGIFDTLRNVASTAVGNIKKDFEKQLSGNISNLKSAISAAAPTQEFTEIKAKLKPLGIEGNNLQAVYNFLYTKDKGNYVFSVDNAIKNKFIQSVRLIQTIVVNYFDNLSISIPTALQEANPRNRIKNQQTQQVNQQSQPKATPQQQIQVLYQKALTIIEDAKTKKEKENILIGSVLSYACQVANQAINIKEAKNPKQLGKLYKEVLDEMITHINKLPIKSQQSSQPSPTP